MTRMQPVAEPQHAWRCWWCGRFLARVSGTTFETPAGVRGTLPAVIRCRCGQRNTRLARPG